MLRRLAAGLLCACLFFVPWVMAQHPGADLVTSKDATEDDTTVELCVRTIKALDNPDDSSDTFLEVPKVKGVISSGTVNGAYKWAIHQRVTPTLHVVGTLDGYIYLYKTGEATAAPLKHICKHNLANPAFGLKAHLQDEELLEQLSQTHPLSIGKNIVLEEFILKNLGLPIHFSQPFKDVTSGGVTSLFAIADNIVFKLSITDEAGDSPDILIALHSPSHICHQAPLVPLNDLLSESKLVASLEKSIADIKQLDLFPDYATGIAWEPETGGGFRIIISMDSRNSYTKVLYDPQKPTKGCKGKPIIMRQLRVSGAPSETPQWEDTVFAQVSEYIPRIENREVVRDGFQPNTFHSLATCTADDGMFAFFQKHHHDRVCVKVNGGYCFTVEREAAVRGAKENPQNHPVFADDGPFLCHSILEDARKFGFQYYLSGAWGKDKRYHHGHSETLQVPYGKHFYTVGLKPAAEPDDPKYKATAKYKNPKYEKGSTDPEKKDEYLDGEYVITVSIINRPEGDEFEARAKTSYKNQLDTSPSNHELGKIPLIKVAGYNHPFDQLVLHIPTRNLTL